jgi:hypothetical protein|nr:TnpV protein [uncultured Blautia sp.]
MESANNMNAGYEVTAFMSKQRSGLRMSTVMTYTKVNGYLIPNLTYKSGEQMEQLGKYGFLRRDYLKNHRNSTYQVMLLQDTIGERLLEVDKAAREREEIILKQLEKKEPLPDKEKDQIAWVRAANQHRAIAEEIILKELIYV